MIAEVQVKCVFCNSKRVIKAGEVAPGDHPMCENMACGGPMVAVQASAKTPPRENKKRDSGKKARKARG